MTLRANICHGNRARVSVDVESVLLGSTEDSMPKKTHLGSIDSVKLDKAKSKVSSIIELSPLTGATLLGCLILGLELFVLTAWC
jgi:hypothetical protein